jgi:amino acid permease
MFAIDATEYLHNTVFHEKLYSLLFTLIFAIVIQKNVEKWDRLPRIPVFGKLIALLCLISAMAMILMGVNVPALTGVG